MELTRRETRICLQCGARFDATYQHDRKFCDRECFAKYRVGRPRDRKVSREELGLRRYLRLCEQQMIYVQVHDGAECHDEVHGIDDPRVRIILIDLWTRNYREMTTPRKDNRS
ncbi:MAG: hypothetical protein PHC88_05680 [Terrimicrobiaceae bacterium]|nr:hypothetical protein [Terrimicrobiaceae bacterium]